MTLKLWIELLLVLDNNGWNHLVFYIWYQDYYDIKIMNRIIISTRKQWVKPFSVLCMISRLLWHWNDE